MTHLDPFDFARADAAVDAVPVGPSLAELHRRWVALEDELAATHEAADELRRKADLKLALVQSA